MTFYFPPEMVCWVSGLTIIFGLWRHYRQKVRRLERRLNLVEQEKYGLLVHHEGWRWVDWHGTMMAVPPKHPKRPPHVP